MCDFKFFSDMKYKILNMHEFAHARIGNRANTHALADPNYELLFIILYLYAHTTNCIISCRKLEILFLLYIWRQR